MTSLNRVLALAKVVRQAFENAIGDKILTSCCYRASLELFTIAKENGINDIKLAGNYCHVFCIVGEDTVVDLTATQFGHTDAIAVGKTGEWPKHLPNSYDYSYWNVVWSGETLEDAKQKGGWTLDCMHSRDREFVLKAFAGEQATL